jgi:hypothetical protein
VGSFKAIRAPEGEAKPKPDSLMPTPEGFIFGVKTATSFFF